MSLLANGGDTGSSFLWSISSSGLESVESGGSSLAYGRLEIPNQFTDNSITKLRKLLTSIIVPLVGKILLISNIVARFFLGILLTCK